MREEILKLFGGIVPRPKGGSPSVYKPNAWSDVGLRRCQRKGHRPPNKTGMCTRCGTFIRIEDLRG